MKTCDFSVKKIKCMTRHFNFAFMKSITKGSRNHQNCSRDKTNNFPNKSSIVMPKIPTRLASKDETSTSQDTQTNLASKGCSQTSWLSYFKVKHGFGI